MEGHRRVEERADRVLREGSQRRRRLCLGLSRPLAGDRQPARGLPQRERNARQRRLLPVRTAARHAALFRRARPAQGRRQAGAVQAGAEGDHRILPRVARSLPRRDRHRRADAPHPAARCPPGEEAVAAARLSAVRVEGGRNRRARLRLETAGPRRAAIGGAMAEQGSIERVWEVVEKARVGMLVTRFSGGLRARPLEARPDRAAGAIFFVTDVRGAKDDEVEATPEVCLVFIDHAEKAYLSITGCAEVRRDPEKAKEIWKSTDD